MKNCRNFLCLYLVFRLKVHVYLQIIFNKEASSDMYFVNNNLLSAFKLCSLFAEPLKVGYWKENSDDEDTIDVQDLPDDDKIDPLLLENANVDTPMENSEGTLVSL